VNPLRTGIIDVLIKMGADIKLANPRKVCNEPVADIRVKSSKLKPIKLAGDIISRLIDELPILFIACACCDGVSIIEDIEELRHKESDRIKSMEEGLMNLGINVKSTSNSITITGGTFRGGIVNSYGDHRIAMSFIVSGFISEKPITVINTENINTSFPNFIDILKENNNEIYHI
jgi:3-phosphoshikimate 1-carboxyvinyltransferase